MICEGRGVERGRGREREVEGEGRGVERAHEAVERGGKRKERGESEGARNMWRKYTYMLLIYTCTRTVSS